MVCSLVVGSKDGVLTELTLFSIYSIYVFVHTEKNFSSQSKAVSSELKAKQKRLAIFTASRFTIIEVEYKP